MSEFEGKIEDADNALKEMRPNKDGTTSWKYGLKVGGVWHSVFGSKAEVEAIKKDVDAGGNYAKGTYKLSKDGKYRNIEEVKISKTEGKAEPRKEPQVQEERLGVEEVEALVDGHYIDALRRAQRIMNLAGQNKPVPWFSDEERIKLTVALFEKLASPKIYAEDEARMRLAKKGAK